MKDKDKAGNSEKNNWQHFTKTWIWSESTNKEVLYLIIWTLPSSEGLKTFFSFGMRICTRCKCSCVCVFTQVLAYVWEKVHVNMCAYMCISLSLKSGAMFDHSPLYFSVSGSPTEPRTSSRKSSRAAGSGAVSWEPGLQMIAMLARLFYVLLFLQLFIIGKCFACQFISAAPKDYQIWLVMSLINVTVSTCGLFNLYAPVVLAALAVKAEGHPQPSNEPKVNLC